MSRNALPESEEAIRATIRAAEAAVMAGAARERERRVHRWECGRCAERMETPKPPAIAPDGKSYCPRCAEAIRPYAATAAQIESLRDAAEAPTTTKALEADVSDRTSSDAPADIQTDTTLPQAAGQQEEPQATSGVAAGRPERTPGVPPPEPARDEGVEPDETPAPGREGEALAGSSKPGRSTMKRETKGMPKKKIVGGARALAEPWKCTTSGCSYVATTAQAVGAHKRWCPRKGAPKLAAKSAPPTPAPSGTITSGWAQEIRIDPPTGATFVVDMKRGPIARFAGVEVELASVEDAVAFVRAMQTSGQQSAAGSVSAKG